MGQSVMQPWTHDLPLMQQTVLMTAIRGPDGIGKYHVTKFILRWFRRCILRCSFGGVILTTPFEEGGGSFTGPSIKPPEAGFTWELGMDMLIDDYLRSLDELPHHFQMHLLHAAEIIGYKHPDLLIRGWWHRFYLLLVNDLHLQPESEADMDERLGDNEGTWRERNNLATQE